MRLTDAQCLRRIMNSSYHPFSRTPTASNWGIRERLRRFNAWQYGSPFLTVRGGYRRLNKTFHYMDMQRTDVKKLERHYSEERLHAALEEQRIPYNVLRNQLDQAHILLDNTVLAQFALYEPLTFKSICMLAKQMAEEEGRPLVRDPEQDNVETDPTLFGQPYPRGRVYAKGSAEMHQRKPRQLKVDEF